MHGPPPPAGRSHAPRSQRTCNPAASVLSCCNPRGWLHPWSPVGAPRFHCVEMALAACKQMALMALKRDAAARQYGWCSVLRSRLAAPPVLGCCRSGQAQDDDSVGLLPASKHAALRCTCMYMPGPRWRQRGGTGRQTAAVPDGACNRASRSCNTVRRHHYPLARHLAHHQARPVRLPHPAARSGPLTGCASLSESTGETRRPASPALAAAISPTL